MPTAVVTGANSGIGHAFANILINEGYEVHAADHEVGEKLQSLQCRLHRLDVRSPESITGLAQQLGSKPLDILLNIAGIMSPPGQDQLDTVTKDSLTRIFETNTFGPLLLTQALLPNLLAAPNSRVGIMSSRVGSITDNTSGGNYAYRASKAGVNAMGKNLALELKEHGVVVSLLHPGIVRSGLQPAGVDLGEEAVEPEEAASKLWAVFMSKGVEETGRFWHREGQELPW